MPRYQKGSLVLHPDRDVEILRQLIRNGFLTRPQLFRLLKLAGTEQSINRMYERVKRLLHHEYIELTQSPEKKGTSVYKIGPRGVETIQFTDEIYSGREIHELASSKEEQTTVQHWLDLADIQIALREAGCISRWIPESEIRAQNDLTPFPYAKDYDAVLDLKAPGKFRIAVEYERLRKTKSRYEEICTSLVHENLVDLVLYVTNNIYIVPFLRNQLARCPIPAAITILKDVRKTNFATVLWPTDGSERIPLSRMIQKCINTKAIAS